MSVSVKPAVVAALVYLRDNPGVVSLVVGELVVLAAQVGLKVTAAQLAAVMAVAIPLLLGYFHVAKKASFKAAEKAKYEPLRQALAGPPIVVEPVPEPELAPVGMAHEPTPVPETPVDEPTPTEPVAEPTP